MRVACKGCRDCRGAWVRACCGGEERGDVGEGVYDMGMARMFR